MNAGADSLLTVRWRDRSFVLRAPEQVEQLARRLRQKGLANIAVSIRGAVVEGSTGSRKVLSDEERKAVCAVLIDAESDPALRAERFTLLCAEPEPLEATSGSKSATRLRGTLLRPLPPTRPAPSGRTSPDRSRLLSPPFMRKPQARFLAAQVGVGVPELSTPAPAARSAPQTRAPTRASTDSTGRPTRDPR